MRNHRIRAAEERLAVHIGRFVVGLLAWIAWLAVALTILSAEGCTRDVSAGGQHERCAGAGSGVGARAAREG